ncbi:hypothetical protein VTL71DRAFT_347 [Oculimacula yallundae]|uniref:Uncharacterized protein n=1 Tax=Oculimacula yallundae TaxID=86028 RepID=A0ABR4CZS5_9HELO
MPLPSQTRITRVLTRTEPPSLSALAQQVPLSASTPYYGSSAVVEIHFASSLAISRSNTSRPHLQLLPRLLWLCGYF